jgi:hypothetical protein
MTSTPRDVTRNGKLGRGQRTESHAKRIAGCRKRAVDNDLRPDPALGRAAIDVSN